MPKLKKVRIINFKYSNNRQYIDDTFDLYNENAISFFQNGGGKTVTCKLLLLPFLWKQKKHFEWCAATWYKTFDGPTYLMEEYTLNESEKILLVASIHRESKDKEENDVSRYIFVSVYKNSSDEFSFENFPVKNENGEIIKPYDLYAKLKNNNNVRCFHNRAQSGSNKTYNDYVEYLNSYNFNVKFYSEITPLILGSEGGISEAFTSYKNTDILLREFIIPIMTGKIPESEEMINSITEQISKIVINEVRNAEDLQNLENFNRFIDELNVLLNLVKEREENDENLKIENSKLVYVFEETKKLKSKIANEITKYQQELNDKDTYLKETRYKKDSYFLTKKVRENDSNKEALVNAKNELNKMELEYKSLADSVEYFKAYICFSEILSLESELDRLEIEKKPYQEKHKELQLRYDMFAKKLYSIINDNLLTINSNIEHINNEICSLNNRKQELLEKNIFNKKRINEIEKEKEKLLLKLWHYERDIEEFNNTYKNFQFQKCLMISPLINQEMEDYEKSIANILLSTKKDISTCIEKIKDLQTESQNNKANKKELDESLKKLNFSLITKKKDKEDAEESIKTIKKEMANIDLYDDDFSSLEIIKNKASRVNDTIDTEQSALSVEIINIKKYLKNLQNKNVDIDENLNRILDENNITFKSGLNYLTKFNNNEEERRTLYFKIPYIVYSIIMTKKEYEKLCSITNNNLSSFCTPIIIEEDLYNISIDTKNSVYFSSDLIIYGGKPDEVYNNNFFENEIEKTNKKLEEKESQKSVLNNKKTSCLNLINEINKFENSYADINIISNLDQEISEISNKIYSLEEQINQYSSRNEEILSEIEILNSEISRLEKSHNETDKENNMFFKIKNSIGDYTQLNNDIDSLEIEKEKLNKDTNNNEFELETISDSIRDLSIKNNRLQIDRNNLDDKINYYVNYKNNERPDFSYNVESLENELKNISVEMNKDSDIQRIDNDIKKTKSLLINKRTSFRNYEHIDKQNYLNINWSTFDLDKNEKLVKELIEKKTEKKAFVNSLNDKIEKCNQEIKNKSDEIIKKYGKDYTTDVILFDFDAEIRMCENNIQTIKENIISAGKDLDHLKKYLSAKESKMIIYETISNLSFDIVVDINNYSSLYEDIGGVVSKIKSQSDKINVKISKKINHIENEFKSIDKLSSCVNNIVKTEKEKLNSSNLNRIIYKIQESINSMNQKVKFINELKKELITLTTTYADKLIDELKSLVKVAKRNYIINEKTDKKVELIKVIIPQECYPTNLEDALNDIIASAKENKDENSINEFIKNKVNSYFILYNYTHINEFGIKLKKKDANAWTEISYSNFVNSELSGAQKMIVSLILIQTFKEFENEEEYECSKHINSSCFLLQDNPFSKIQTCEYVDIFFKLAEKYGIQLWSWTDVKDAHIIDLHNVIFTISIKQSNGKEYNQVTTESSISQEDNEIHEIKYEQISLF